MENETSDLKIELNKTQKTAYIFKELVIRSLPVIIKHSEMSTIDEITASLRLVKGVDITKDDVEGTLQFLAQMGLIGKRFSKDGKLLGYIFI